MGFEIEYQESWLAPELNEILMYVIGGDWGREPTYNDEDYQEVLCIRGSEFRNWQKNKGNTASIRKISKANLNGRQLIEGDILLEISGGGPDQPVGRTVLVDKQTLLFEPTIAKVCTNFLRLMRFPKALNHKFINFYFDFFYTSGEIVNYQGGSNNLRNLKFAEFSKIKIPLPPLNEQHRIVSKIEELFSDLDNGLDNLKKAQNQLKVYRQALLKAAFEGKLTEQWRKVNNPEPAEKLLERIKEERQKRYEQELKEWKEAVKIWEKGGKKGKKPGKLRVNMEIISSIRANNVMLKVEDTSTHIVDCLHSTPKFQKEGKYCVDTTCITDGQIIWDKIRLVSEESFKERISRLRPEKGDVLFAREGTVGTTLVLNNQVDICLGQRMMMFRPYSYILSKYFMYYFQSIEFKKQYKPLIGGTTAPHLNIGVIKKLLFPVCSIIEQRKIIDELEDRISLIDNLEQTIKQGIKKSESLRQSILKEAFEGKLIAKDTNDEPVSELLKRIQAEKAKYVNELKQDKKNTPKKIKTMSKELSITEVLKASEKPMLAKDVWQQSKHKESIEEFYTELKKIQNNIKEVKKGTESLLSFVE